MPGRHAPARRRHRRLRRRRTGQPEPRHAARASGCGACAPTRTRRRSSGAPTVIRTRVRRTSRSSTSAAGTSATTRGDPVVIDWRAPIARAFYRATPADRMGVRLRRRFGFQHGVLIVASRTSTSTAARRSGLRPDLLREEIERPRVGPMRDIVATIQPDQDELVRADLDTSLCIQGAPGTGKTAVGLHRAAYLLYTYPERLRRSGVLVVGPNRAFLHYIAPGAAVARRGRDRAGHGRRPRPARCRAGHEPADAGHAQGRRPDGRRAAPRACCRHVAQADRGRRSRSSARGATASARTTCAATSTTPAVRWPTGCAGRSRASGCAPQVAEDVRRQREDVGGAPSDAETAKVAALAGGARRSSTRVWPALDRRRRCSLRLLRRRRRSSPDAPPAPDRGRAGRAVPAGAAHRCGRCAGRRRHRAARRARPA